MMIVPYRITPEDLVDLDAKTRDALIPLIDAINRTLSSLVAQAQSVRREKELESTFETGTAGTAYVDFNPSPIRDARSLTVDQIRRSDSVDMTLAYGMSWYPLASGAIRALFTGLDPSVSYFVRVTLK